MKKKLILLIVFFSALVLTIYPANQLYQKHKTRSSVLKFEEKVNYRAVPSKESVAEKISKVVGNIILSETSISSEVLDENQQISSSGNISTNKDAQKTVVNDVFGTGGVKNYEPAVYDDAVGYVYIPKINFLQMLYLGASEHHLHQGVAQLSSTSLPLSGVGHQTVIAGHRGGYNSPQFLYVDQLNKGDHIYISYLNEKAVYTVEYSDVIRDYGENETLADVPNIDLLTLYTCHPYPNNYERLLVRSLRDKTALFEKPVSADNTKEQVNIQNSVDKYDSTGFLTQEKILNQDRKKWKLQTIKNSNTRESLEKAGSNPLLNLSCKETIPEKISSVFTSLTNKYQNRLLTLWTIIGVVWTLKISYLLFLKGFIGRVYRIRK